MTTLVVLAFAIPLVVLIRNNAYDDAVTDTQREAADISRLLFSYNGAATEAEISAYLKTLDQDRAVMGGCLTEVRLGSVVVEHKGVPACPQR